jgi:type II secretory pathway component PulJ
MRVDPAQQRARDSDARRILESELAREESALAVLRKDYNNGEPERRGDERNFARYQERVAEMKAAIARKEADVAAIRRELSKLPNP